MNLLQGELSGDAKATKHSTVLLDLLARKVLCHQLHRTNLIRKDLDFLKEV
jgi:hypothetical protein